MTATAAAVLKTFNKNEVESEETVSPRSRPEVQTEAIKFAVFDFKLVYFYVLNSFSDSWSQLPVLFNYFETHNQGNN